MKPNEVPWVFSDLGISSLSESRLISDHIGSLQALPDSLSFFDKLNNKEREELAALVDQINFDCRIFMNKLRSLSRDGKNNEKEKQQ